MLAAAQGIGGGGAASQAGAGRLQALFKRALQAGTVTGAEVFEHCVSINEGPSPVTPFSRVNCVPNTFQRT